MPLPKLLIVTGKGGVGKSTVTAALAHALARQKKKIAAIELTEQRLASFFKNKNTSYEGTPLDKNITGFCIDPSNAFREYATLKLKSQTLYKILLDNRLVANFIHATPGLNEILMLGKIAWLLESQNFDHLILDAPATGHTLALLDAPRVALKALQLGPLKTQVGSIVKLLHDPHITQSLIVTLPEELPIEEGIELYEHLRTPLEISILGSVVNGTTLALEKEILTALKTPPNEPWEEPFVNIVRQEWQGQQREQVLIQEWRQQVKVPTFELTWQEPNPSDTELKEILAEKLTPWTATL